MPSRSTDPETSQRKAIEEAHAKALALKRKRADLYGHKEKQEIAELKKQLSSDSESGLGSEEEDSDSETEDEDGQELDPAKDVAFLKTLALIQKKDPSIYDKTKSVYEEQEKQASSASLNVKRPRKEKESKPVTYKSQLAANLLNPTDTVKAPQPLTHVEEQAALRSETISAFHTAISEDEEDDLLVLRNEDDTKDDDDDEYRELIKREVGDVKQLLWVDKEARAAIEPEPSSSKGPNPRSETNPEEFLANYLLNRGWIDRSEKRLPTFNDLDDPEINDDFEELEEDFEATYNFRFEEPDGSKIPRHPRTIDTLARRTESKRKETRERRKERKEDEVRKKKEEVRHKKNVKMKELQDKLEEIGKEGGLNLAAAKATLEALDVDGDFDPVAYDKQMAALYNDDDNYGERDDAKPEWDDDLGLEEDFPDMETPAEPEPEPEPAEGSKKKKKKKKDKKQKGAEPELAAMDVDDEEEEWDGTEEMRKRVLNKYLDEVYKLDFNDMAGGMPTRFTYQPVPKANFSLTSAEILMATDKELNNYVGLKSIAPHKKQTWDSGRGQKLKELKMALAGRRWGYVGKVGGPRDGNEKRRSKGKESSSSSGRDKERASSSGKEKDTDGEPKKKKRKRSKGKKEAVAPSSS